MPQLQFSAILKAPVGHVWTQLVNKVYHPELFLPGVQEVKILEDGPGNRAVRQMTLNGPHGQMVILEEITWDESTHIVDFRILEHPSHTGNVINRIDLKKEGDSDEVWLTYEMNWVFKGEGADPLESMNLKVPVLKSIEYIETQLTKDTA